MELNFDISNLSYFQLALVIIMGLALLIQLIYYLLIFSKLAFYKCDKRSTNENEPVSVIISAHDEDYNLRNNLESILKQKYDNFEVVVVDHASSDETAEILKDFGRSHSHLKIVTIKQDLNFFKGKKFPLSIGIKSASNDILLLTDADCKPNSEYWISEMVSNYKGGTEIVLGYGPHLRRKGFFDKIIRYDTFIIALQYFSMALSGLPYMGVGRNLSYRKSLFYKNKGFISHYGISSGDDDLFIMQVATKKNVSIEIARNAYMYSKAKPDFGSWFTQKSRHITTGKVYPFKFKILLGSFQLTLVLLYLSFFILLGSNILIIPAIAAMVLYTAVRVFIQKKAASKLEEEQLLLFSLIGDLMHITIMIIIYLRSLIKKQKHWK